MSWKSGVTAGFLFAIISGAATPLAGIAQPAWDLNRVIAAEDDGTGTAVVLKTLSDTPLSAPSIQYLPGPSATTIMVADFFGVVFKLPAKIIRPPASGDPHNDISQVTV